MLKGWFGDLRTWIKELLNQHSHQEHRGQTNNTRGVQPIIWIPGSSAGIHRFNATIKQINRFKKEKHSLLKILVKKDHSLLMEGHVHSQNTNPFIVIGFENNRDGYHNIQLQVAYLQVALTYLIHRYSFKSFQAVCHSNGGLILTGLLESKFFKENDLSISKLVLIGSPFTFDRQMFEDFQEQRKQLPKQLKILNIVGAWTRKSDGIVPLASAKAADKIFKNQEIELVTITGRKSHHSALPNNAEVIQLIKQFLGF